VGGRRWLDHGWETGGEGVWIEGGRPAGLRSFGPAGLPGRGSELFSDCLKAPFPGRRDDSPEQGAPPRNCSAILLNSQQRRR